MRPTTVTRLAVALALGLAPLHQAFASTASTGMPWEGAIAMFVSSITGPVGTGVALLGLAVAGIRWMKSGHGEGADWLMRAAIGTTLIVGGTNLLTTMGILGSVL